MPYYHGDPNRDHDFDNHQYDPPNTRESNGAMQRFYRVYIGQVGVIQGLSMGCRRVYVGVTSAIV